MACTRTFSPRRLPLGMACAALAASLALAAAPAGAAPTQPPSPSAPALVLTKIGSYASSGGQGAAEIPAYDPATQRAFVVNGALRTVEVLDLSDPTTPVLVTSIATPGFGPDLGGANSVAVAGGIVALAVEAVPRTNPGVVVLLDAATLSLISTATVGALPDMLTFTPDGKTLLVANEGEPAAYGTGNAADDPEGSVSVIDVSKPNEPRVRTADFRAYDGKEAELRRAGVRIFGPGASVAQDLEPEYITVSRNGKTAWVTLQENNALAVIDVRAAQVTAILPLGSKDHSLEGQGLDASNEDGGVDTNSGTPVARIVPQPVKGLYMPDSIASYQVRGRTYLVTANEGDAREYSGLVEELRVREYCTAGLDPAVFGADAGRLLFDSNLGRLLITTTPNGGDNGKNAAGQCTALHAFGGRSFTIWDAEGRRVFDSGDALERITLEAAQASGGRFAFNASHNNNTLDSRSPSKGPEPEGLAVGRIGARIYAFVGLERVGGIVVYDVTEPQAPSFVTYVNERSGTIDGDRGPEGLALVGAEDSPNGKPLLIVGHEVSGTTVVYQIDRLR